MEYGLTENGFIQKPLSVIIEEERAAAKETFGEDIDLSDDSVMGKYIGNRAAKVAQLWELMAGIVAIGDVDQASGIYLDRLTQFVNVFREAAISTEVTACLWGDEGTKIYSGSLVKLNTTGDLFALRSNVEIGRDSLLGFRLKTAAVETGAVYSFHIDGVTVEYTAQEDDDEDAIQEGLAEALEAALPGLFVSENLGGDGLKIHTSDGVTPFSADVNDDKLEIALLGAYGVYTAQNAGPVYAPAGTLTEIVSNVDGLDSVFNYATGVTGRVVESDTELRAYLGNRQRQSAASEAAIQNEIEKITGVQYARIYSNRSMQIVNGRPPKSYESVIVGGDDKTIAETIFNKGPAGVQPFGNTVVTLQDNEGFPWEIGFSRPVNRYIWVRIGITLNNEEQFPLNGNDLIKDNIVSWAAKNMNVGIDLIYQRLGIPIYSVQGIATADIKVARTADLMPPEEADYQSANINIGEVEIAVFDRGRITVEELVT